VERLLGQYYPVIIDCETSGISPEEHAILELAYTLVDLQDGRLVITESETFHLEPFEGALFDAGSMKIHQIDPYYPLRYAITEKQALEALNQIVMPHLIKHKQRRAVLVGHNAWFDLSFLNSAYQRQKVTSVFHRFTTIDTASLGAFFLRETVLARALQRLRISYDPKQAHGALYDSQKTAEMLCALWNRQYAKKI
jgi:ribonuclease T